MCLCFYICVCINYQDGQVIGRGICYYVMCVLFVFWCVGNDEFVFVG